MPKAVRELAVLAAAIVVLSGCAERPENVAIGEIMTPGNTQVPLPPGEWKLLATENIRAGNLLGGGINNDTSVRTYYAKIENGRIVQTIYVNTSSGALSSHGYVTGADCVRTAPSDFIYFADTRSAAPNAIDCVKVTGDRVFNPPSRTSSDIYRQAYDSAKAYGGLPRYGVRVEIAQAHGQRFEDYYITFFPDQSAAQTRSSDWRVDDMTPAHRDFANGVIEWAKTFRDVVRLGTDYRL